MEFQIPQVHQIPSQYSELRNRLDSISAEISIWLLMLGGIGNLERLSLLCREGLEFGSGQDSDSVLPGKVIARIRRLWAFASFDQFLSQLTNLGLCKTTDAVVIMSAQRRVATWDEANAFVALNPFVDECERLASSAGKNLVEHAELRGRAFLSIANGIAQTVFGCSASRIVLIDIVQAAINVNGQSQFGDRGEANMMFAPDFIPSCSLSSIHPPSAELLERIDGLRAALAWREREALSAQTIAASG